MHRLLAVAVHIFCAQADTGVLNRVIALSRNGMVNRFAPFTVADLSVDAAGTMTSGRAFITACLVAARFKDKLQITGYRWTGEKTLITRCLNVTG